MGRAIPQHHHSLPEEWCWGFFIITLREGLNGIIPTYHVESSHKHCDYESIQSFHFEFHTM